MSESELSPGKLYLEEARTSGLLNGKNKAGFLAIAEMLDNPCTLEQMKAQIERAKVEREKLRKTKTG